MPQNHKHGVPHSFALFAKGRAELQLATLSRPLIFSPIQQLIGQLKIHDSQYQCGQPLPQLGIVATIPMTSPITKNHSTCRPARLGANRAHTHAQRIETTIKHAVLAINALFDGICPRSKSPGNIRESNGSLATTSATESK